MNNNEQLLKGGTFPRLLLTLCVPSIVIMLVLILYNIADVFFIGQLGDPYMVAAVSLAGPVFTILSGIGTLFGSGGCTVISLALGSGDHARIRKTSALCFYFSLITGILFGAAVLLLLKPICRILGANSLTLNYTVSYMRIICFFAPVSLISGVFVNLIRADGSAKQSMMANILGTVTNIILDPILILVLGWGVSGAALATGIGNAASLLYVLRYIRKRTDMYSLKRIDAAWDRHLMGAVLTLGFPIAVSTILMSFSHIISNNLLVSYDSIAVAAQSIAGKVGMLNTMIAMRICMGMQPAISYNFAAKSKKRTIEILEKTCFTTVITGLVISAVCFIFRDSILVAFINDTSVISIGRIALPANIIVGPIYGIYQMATTYFQSTGRAGYATVCSLLNKGAYYIPLLFLLNAVFGLYGVLFTAAATDLLSVITAVIMVKHVIRGAEI